MAHRVLQAFDTAQFILMTSGGADLVLLGGDLNTEPDDLAYQVLLLNANLSDAYHQDSSVGPNFYLDYIQIFSLFLLDVLYCFVLSQLEKTNFGTFATARNSYSDRSSLQKSPNGQRIDYVLFKGGHRAQVRFH